MLATLSALHLLLLTQAAPVVPFPPVGPDGADEAAQPAPPQQENPPLPRKESAPRPTAALPAAAEAPAEPAEPAPARPAEQLPAPRTIPTPPTQLSLLSAEPLGGGSAMLAQAGWSQLSFLYAQGITPQDDLGGFVDLDWSTTELHLGLFYRHPFRAVGPFAMAGRFELAWYKDFGGTWFHDSNHEDRGLEANPGVSLSQRTRSGIVSIIGEVPLTLTLRADRGILFRPRVSLAYEAPLYDGYTLGARVGIGYRGGAGDAPISGSRAELTFLLVGGYRVF